MLWQLMSFPKCQNHVFLSHCREDRDALVRPVYKSLSEYGVISFIDVADYYYGRDSRSALKDGILDSRHVVFFITDALLNNTRGWCVLELAFAEMLDSNFHFRGGKLANAYLPLFLIPQADERLPRSVWQVVRDRGRFFDPVADGDPAVWCSLQIREFLQRESQLSQNWGTLARRNLELTKELSDCPISGVGVDKMAHEKPILPERHHR